MVISNTETVVTAISAVNECVTFFQWVRSLWSHWNRRENQEEDDVPKLQSSLGFHSSGTEKQEKKKRKREKKQDVLKLQSSFQCLHDTLPAMYNFINRVESRSHEKGVAELLPEFKAAVYDAEGLLKYFRCYEQKVKIEGSATSMETVTKFFQDCIQDNFYTKFTAIKNRLYNQYMMMDERMALHQATLRFDRSVRLRPQTTSFPNEPTVFGRDDEIKELIRMLGVPSPSRLERERSAIRLSESNQVCGSLDNNKATITSVPVLPIVGIGGVGKTTLAQMIFHYPQVQEHFDVIVWTCVSDLFNDFDDVKSLTKVLIELFPRKHFSDKRPTENNLSSLQAHLANRINKRRFLVVLDDMWAENGELWKTFYAPFKDVLEGSMMLVTTRSRKVADIVRTMDPFLLEGLEDAIFSEYFKLCAFGYDRSNNNPELEWIGKQILPKLKGSPLAAKTLGRLLRMSLDPAHWNMILNSQLWELKQYEDDILPALRLSYMKLPFHLKRCFLLCAMYQKGFNFVKEDLVEIWMAEGFVEPERNIPLQQTACKYFEELAHLSFFQKFHGKYVIHDLMHDMAQLVLKDECFIIKEKKDIERIPQTDIPLMWEPQHFASTSAGTQAATSFHIDVPPIWPHPMSRRQRGQIDSDSSILKVLNMVLCMNKDMSNALHREKQARKRDSKRIKSGLRQIKKLRKEAGKEVSPSGSEAEELEVESEGEQYPDVDALVSQVRSEQQYGQSYAQGGGYGYGFCGQFHPGPSSSSALQQHQQFGPRDYFNAANTSNSSLFSIPSVCHFYGGTSPAGSGYGYGGRLSFTDSEASYGSEPDSPPPEGKGKAVAVDGGRRRRRTTRNPGGFMAAARRSHPQVDGHPSSYSGGGTH